MTLSDIFPFLAAAGIVVLVICIKVATMRMNKKRKQEGKDPVPEQEFVNVIDWTQRK